MLISKCLLRQDFRCFRVDRIKTLEVTETHFRPHRTSLLRDALAQLEAEHPNG